MRNVLDKICKALAFYEKMSKNSVETEGPKMTSQYDAYELYAG
jgi:hypothetical protein